MGKINLSRILEKATVPTEGLNLFVGEDANIWVIPDTESVKMDQRCEYRLVYEANFWNDIEGFILDNSYAPVFRCGTLEKLPVEPNKTVEAAMFHPKTGDVVIDTNKCVVYLITKSLVKIIK